MRAATKGLVDLCQKLCKNGAKPDRIGTVSVGGRVLLLSMFLGFFVSIVIAVGGSVKFRP